MIDSSSMLKLALLLAVVAAGVASAATVDAAAAPSGDGTVTVWVHPDSQALLDGNTAHVHMFVLAGPYTKNTYVGGGQYRLEGDTQWIDMPPLYDEHQVMETNKLPAPHPFSSDDRWVQGFNFVFGASVHGNATKIHYKLWAAEAALADGAKISEAKGSLPIRSVDVAMPTSQPSHPIQVSMLIAKAYTDGVDTHVHLVVDFYPPSQTLVASAWLRSHADDAEWIASGAVSQFEHFFDPVVAATAGTKGKLFSRYNLSWKIPAQSLTSLSCMVSAQDGQVVGVSDSFVVPVERISVGAVATNTTDYTCTIASVTPILSALFASLGNDCDTYVSLYASDARYYHQHDGFKTTSQLLANCQGYAKFCPAGTCSFQQNGVPSVVADKGTGECRILAPYLWAELPANGKVPGNMEPHTGWEYIVVTADTSARFGYSINLFAEVETSYSVALNWGRPNDTSVYNWTTQLLGVTASKGECDFPIAPLVTHWLQSRRNNLSDVWRQQGDAVVLAVGGVCHVAVPFASEVDKLLQTGRILFVLQPNKKESTGYTIERTVEFLTPTTASIPTSCLTPSPLPSDSVSFIGKIDKNTLFAIAIAGWVVAAGFFVVAIWMRGRQKKANHNDYLLKDNM